MSAEMDALTVVNQLRDLAADPLNRRAIVEDQGCLPGLILFLDHPNPQVVYSALLVRTAHPNTAQIPFYYHLFEILFTPVLCSTFLVSVLVVPYASCVWFYPLLFSIVRRFQRQPKGHFTHHCVRITAHADTAWPLNNNLLENTANWWQLLSVSQFKCKISPLQLLTSPWLRHLYLDFTLWIHTSQISFVVFIL